MIDLFSDAKDTIPTAISRIGCKSTYAGCAEFNSGSFILRKNASSSMRCERLDERSNCCHLHLLKEPNGPCGFMAVNLPIRVAGGVPDRTLERKMALSQKSNLVGVQWRITCSFAELQAGLRVDVKG